MFGFNVSVNVSVKQKGHRSDGLNLLILKVAAVGLEPTTLGL